MQARLPLIAAFVAALLPGKAFAQAWISSRDLSEGAGIRAGNLELHPSLGAEFGYDSNLFRAAESEGVVDVFKLRITPSISVSTLGGQRLNTKTDPPIAFVGDANLSYQEFIPTDSSNEAVSKRRNLGMGANAKLDIFPRRKFGVDLLAGYARIIQTEGDTQDLAGEGFNRNVLRAGGGLNWRPGGGLFEWRAGYLFSYHFFEADAFKQVNNVHHDLGTRGRWRFLPRSALLFDSTYTLIRYVNRTSQTDGDLMRARIGFHGLVTYHLSILAMVGWGASFYKGDSTTIPARQFDSPLGNAELRWYMQGRTDLDEASATTGLSSIALGYARTFSNSYLGSFYQRDRGYLQFEALIANAFVSGLEFGVSRVAFPESGVAPEFQQLRLDARAFGEYRVTQNFGVNATVQYDQVNSDTIPNEDLDFKRWQAYIGARLFW